MKQEIQKKIFSLEHKALFLKRISVIRNILISHGAYSDGNMESQNIKFEKLNVPEWEKQIIQDSWASTKKLSHELLQELKELNNIILNENKENNKDIVKQILKKKHTGCEIN